YIEKLLRVTEVKRIYILLRPKGGKSIEDRLSSLCQNALFDKLRNSGVTPMDRIQPISGDCNLVNLGISEDDRKLLIKDVNVVVHLAATVRFHEPLHKAVAINVRATLDLIHLAKEMKNLQAFVHVSSAFANCIMQSIDEKYYTHKLGISSVKMCELSQTLGVETTNKLANVLCEAYPNTYTYTKSLAEEAVLSEGRSLPISIFRPAIVIQTYNEPLSGWIGNYYGPSAALYAVGCGVLRVMMMKSHHRAHLVPADCCASLMLAIGWETANSTQRQKLDMAPPIYNYANDDENPLNWKQYMTAIADFGDQVALTKMLWFPFLITVGQKWLYYVLTFFYHTIPGYLIDFVLVLKGKKKRLTKLYRSIHRQTGAMEYFIITEFKFTMDNTKALWNSLSAKDKEIFNFDLRLINWKEYLQYSLWGMRLYLGREGPDTLPRAQIMHRRFKILHYFVQVVFCGLFISLLWAILKRVLL
ncbi:unnamed protein product, partial [Ceratitis capitata]